MPEAPQEDAEVAADHVQSAAPRLVRVAARTTISFGLWDGANRALLAAAGGDSDAHQCAIGYSNDCASMIVIRLDQLLDRKGEISLQAVYRRLVLPAVVDTLVRRACSVSLISEAFADRTEESIRSSVSRFLEAYRGIVGKDVHSRLQHFRNHGLAHLTAEGIRKRITYAELRQLVLAVTVMAECLAVFAPDDVPVREHEIEEWSERALATLEAPLRAVP